MRLPVELINVWNPAPPAEWLGPVLAAPFIGSFAGVLIARLPRGLPVAASRSECPRCGHRLEPAELIPLLSYALQRGRCRACGAPIAPFHLDVELAALGVALWAATVTGAPLLWPGCVLGWTLLALGWIDATSLRLPDLLTLPLLASGLAEAWLLDPDVLPDRALAAALGYAVFRLIALAYRRLRGRDGLGHGDAKLLAAGGAWLGTACLGQIVLTAAILGLLQALWLRLRGRDIGAATRIAFGPCLALGIWLAWLYAP